MCPGGTVTREPAKSSGLRWGWWRPAWKRLGVGSREESREPTAKVSAFPLKTGLFICW